MAIEIGNFRIKNFDFPYIFHSYVSLLPYFCRQAAAREPGTVAAQGCPGVVTRVSISCGIGYHGDTIDMYPLVI